MKIGHHVRNLIRLERYMKNPFRRSAFPNHRANQIPLHVMANRRGEREVRPFRATGRIRAMTEGARLRELSSATRNRTRLGSILARSTRATREEKCDGYRQSLHHPHATWSGNPNPHLKNDPGRYLN